jgi:carbonic anhydrase/acetyltransferase-like protein (isoleucine patch superfamily)
MANVRFTKTSGGYFCAPNAVVVGDVAIGAGTSFWFNCVVRGDVAPISIGTRVNVQDNATIHCDSGVPNVIEDDVVIGHNAIVHGAHIGAGTLIGMGATVLGKTRIGERCLIAAGAVVSPGMEVPDDHVVMGVPGKIVRPTREAEQQYMRWLATHYVELATRYADEGFVDRTK